MPSNVLALVQSFSREYGLPVPVGLAGSSDGGALQMRELLQTVGEDIQGRSNWQQCSRYASWVSVAGTDQGSVAAACPENFDYIYPDTFWNMTLRRPMEGPTSDLRWQYLKAILANGPLYYYRIANNRIETSTAMPASHTLALMYKTKNWLLSTGVTPAAIIAADNDVSYFSDSLMKKGLRAFWLRAKQMPHRFEMEVYESALKLEGSQTAVKAVLNMAGGCENLRPGIMIPVGNWTVP